MVTGPNKAYYGYSYGFPKGKINENESGIQCAIREVWEEIGFNCEQYISEDNCITYMPSQEKVNKFYIVDGVDENTNFKTQKILKFIAALEKWIENINEQSEKNNAFTKKENFIRQKMNNQFQIDRYNEFKKLLEVQAKGFSQLFEPKNEYLIVPVKQDNMSNNPFDEFKLDTEKLNNIFFQ
ncbi:NUDIX hydrolase domain protein [Pseudocohnilembus persalinus]|uniref:NUDIX hydrolase domain protein n=1 Tax=Pseudocohnilembus persalinus TaxID=266149 RepID=A0A0V0QQZ4_PSEPJ|nr:NUDIX hydrolase domain protein [Pseudocohnilembus persalinus]|eukprot:KRX04722.1 NUDIX hydrolase domain protein [Pseudocohnilembus persalinus]